MDTYQPKYTVYRMDIDVEYRMNFTASSAIQPTRQSQPNPRPAPEYLHTMSQAKLRGNSTGLLCSLYSKL